MGANGAGASGGPLVSAGSSIDLDGVPADAQNSVNKQVRVTGRIDARPEGAGAAGAGNATVGGRGTGAANSGASGSGVGATSPSAGGTSTRDDVRANSTTAASGEPNSAAARRVTVETVQVVAQTCAR